MPRPRATLLPALLALAAAAACGGKGAAAGDPLAHRGGTAPPAAPGITLADDLAELTRAAKEGEAQTAWPERSTFLGWTTDRRAAYRVLVCNPDELGGRGPYCELRVCHASAEPTYSGPQCEDAAQFELYGDIDFDAAATRAAAEATVKAFGPLAAGTARPLTAAALDTEGLGLTVHIFDRPHQLMPAGAEEDLGVVDGAITYVGDSPDGRCRVVLGNADVRSEYEGVRGIIPFLFAAVGCP